MEQAPDAMILADPQGRILLVNAQTVQMFGWARDELLGSDISRLIPERFRERHPQRVEAFAQQQKQIGRPMCADTQLWGLHRDGREIPIEITLSPIPEHGHVVVLAAIRDVTGRNLAEDQARVQYREQTALAEATAAQAQLHWLAEVSARLSSSLDHEETMGTVAKALVPYLADGCLVHLVADDAITQVATASADPHLTDLIEAMASRYPPDPAHAHGIFQVVRSGQPELLPTIPDDRFVAAAQDAEHLRLLRAAGMRSVMIVPMAVDSHVIGTITLASTQPARQYGPRDLELAMLLASRCARAVENANLYQRAQLEIAERQRAELELAAEKERLAVTLESIGDGVIATDTAGRVTLLNRVGEKITGWTFADAIGQPVAKVFDVRDLHTDSKLPDPVSQRLARPGASLPAVDGSAAPPQERTRLISRDGTARTILASSAPIRDRDGRLCGVTLVFRDLTRRERIEEELLRAAKLESLGVLAGGIAHDFNNMLTGILANVSMAADMLPRDSEVRACLRDAEKAAQRARLLTTQLLTFAKGGAPVRKAIALGPVVREAAAFALAGSNSRPAFDIAADLWPVAADAGQIGQVVQNLVLNAAQAMPGGGTVSVRAVNRLATHQREPWVRICVTDTGAGIAADVLPRIFDPYFTTKPTGSGLGLATAYAIVLKHDGLLAVKSQPGIGTTFVIDLPACTMAPEASQQRPAAARKTARVLVMDDDEIMRTTATSVLRAMGYQVQVARDGTDAIEMFRVAQRIGEPFDVVVLDLTVPGGMGGREALVRLRELDPAARAVVSSGYSEDPVMAEYRAHGFAGMVGKPYTAADLDAAIQSVLAGPASIEGDPQA